MLARGSAGFSGADLANLVNEAALNAARYNQKVVRMHDFEFAKDKVLMGSERRSMIISDAEKRVTAIHEAGHALLTVLLPHADPIHKVTIIPRGMALGLTQQLPADEKHNYSRDYLNDQIAILLGGRIAEEITMDSLTTGAGNDLERATELARRMVCEWGMSDAMGPLTFGKKEEQIFLGREIAQHQDYSEDTALKIDQEVKRFVTDNYQRAHRLLTEQQGDAGQDGRRAARARSARRRSGAGASPPACRSTSRSRSPRAPRVADEDEARPRQKERAPIVPCAQQAAPAGIGARQSRLRSRQFESQRCHTCSTTDFLTVDSVFPRRLATPSLFQTTRRSRLGDASLVMGILNVTPDSFAETAPATRSRRAPSTRRCAMEADGADLIDIGGESTRPGRRAGVRRRGAGARPAGARRRSPAGCGFRSRSTPTRPTSRARRSRAGAAIVNDVSGLRYDPALARVVGRQPAPRWC